MIIWMIVNGEIAVYSSRAKVRAHVYALQFLYDLREKAGEETGPKMDAAIREAYSSELAEQLEGKGPYDPVYDDPQGWNEAEGPQAVDPGYFLFADEIDWDKGELRIEDLDADIGRPEFLFPNEDLLATEFENHYFDAEFSGLSFDRQAVEMLLPSGQLPATTVTEMATGGRPRPTGRPPKWDWEGALAFVISQAQQPDGLPTGPGAQARLEKMMSDWFMGETGDAPAPSQIRQRASSISRMLERPNKPEKS
jgi:hypothetical protein